MPAFSMDFLTHRSHRMDFDSVFNQDFLFELRRMVRIADLKLPCKS